MSLALANKHNYPVIRVLASDISSKWTGGAAEKTRKLFEAASKQKCVIIIDEIGMYRLTLEMVKGQYHFFIDDLYQKNDHENTSVTQGRDKTIFFEYIEIDIRQ